MRRLSISSSGSAVLIAVLITVSSTSSNHLPPDLAPTLITDCPLYHIPDPESPDGPCICDMDTCPAPDCPHPSATPIAIISATSCCPTYQCVNCPDEDLAAHRCHCSMLTDTHVDNSSYVNEGGQCACSGDEMTWDWYAGCQCDEGKCRLPDLCLGNSVEVRVMEGCCERVECVECPEDSVAQTQRADEIEAKCVCRVCPEKVCSENEVTVIRKPGRNVPNHCCDLYDCIEKGCSINGTKYDEGEQWLIEKDAQKCRCQNGIALCNKLPKEPKENELKNCFYNGNSFRDGDVWTVDQCTNCTCHSGQPKCIAHLCMQINETVVTQPSACPPTFCGRLQCAEYETDGQGCQLCLCKRGYSDEDDSQPGERDTETTDMLFKVVFIVVGCVGIFVVATIFFVVRRKCKRMRYYPETKHNLLLDNNNTSRDIYTSTTKPDDQITLPLYKATTIENARN